MVSRMTVSIGVAPFTARGASRRFVSAIVALAIVSPAAASAQEQAPAAVAACPDGAQECASVSVAPRSGVRFVDALPDASPRDDKAFQFTMGAFVTAAGSDITLSMYQIGRGNAREAGFGRWWQDEPVALAISKSAAIALFAYELQAVHKRRPKLALVLGIAATALESALAVRSALMHARSVAGPPAF